MHFKKTLKWFANQQAKYTVCVICSNIVHLLKIIKIQAFHFRFFNADLVDSIKLHKFSNGIQFVLKHQTFLKHC